MVGAGVLALVLLAGPLWSQDSHYWTEQFGNRARLLGGAVIGGGTDISVVYYNPGALALMEKPRDYSFYNVRLVWKIGLATYWEKWRLGLTVTTPSLSLFGNGTSTFNSSQIVQATTPSVVPLTFVAVDDQKVSSEYRSPLSIGFGASRSFGPTRLYISGEWFQSIGPYTVLDTEPFQSQSSGETLSSDVIHELDSVTNVAIGIEHALNGGRTVYGSFWTDFNATADDSVSNVSGSPFDLYHFGGGYSFPVGSSDITLGGVVAFGSAETSVDLKPPELESDTVNTRYLRVTFILGFNFALATGG